MSTTQAAQMTSIKECLDEALARLDAINVAVSTAPSLETAQAWAERETGHGRAYLRRAETLLGIDTSLTWAPLPPRPSDAAAEPAAEPPPAARAPRARRPRSTEPKPSPAAAKTPRRRTTTPKPE